MDITRGRTLFSLSEPVERVNDLIAVHGIWLDDLVRSLDLGGLAMPSIAVIRDNMEHDKYGSISLLFDSDTIDPEASKDNRVWGGDAYTPTFPTVERKFNEAKGREIERHILDVLGFDSRNEFHDTVKGLSLPNFDQNNLTNKLRHGTDEQTKAFLDNYRRNYKGPSAEERAEMQAAIGKGTTVVDIITGERISL